MRTICSIFVFLRVLNFWFFFYFYGFFLGGGGVEVGGVVQNIQLKTDLEYVICIVVYFLMKRKNKKKDNVFVS